MGCPTFPTMPPLLPRRNKLRFMESSFITIWIFPPFSPHPDILILKKKKKRKKRKRIPLSNKDLEQSFGIQVFKGFPGSSAGKESECNTGDLGSILGLGRSPGEGKSYPSQYSGLENSIDYIVHGVTKSQT